jgi:flagellar hook-associated protein 3 FlgL
MRIADKMAFDLVNQHLAKNREDMAELQNQAALQKRITKPSDDPTASARVLANRTEERGNAQFLKNISYAKSFLEFSDQTLNEMSDILVRAKEIAINQSNDASGNSESRRIAAPEIEQIYNQLVQIGNRKLGDRFIFGGFKTQTKPFNTLGEYSGDRGYMKIQTQKGAFVPMNIPGSKIFLGEGFGGNWGASSSEDMPLSIEELKQRQAQEIEFQKEQKAEENSFIATRGPASRHSQEFGVRRDPINPESGVNIFATLRDLEVSLRTNDKEGVQACLDRIDQSISQVVMSRSEVGARIISLNNTTDSLQKAVVDNKVSASLLEDADAFQVMSDMSKTDSALKATLETSGKLIQPSLIEFLR